jgi:uncharacterized protein YjlB
MPKHLLYFKDDGDIPNHPRWPLLLYPRALDPETLARSETAFDELFAKNDWIVRFRAGIYSFIHYHSNAHEVWASRGGMRRCNLAAKQAKQSAFKWVTRYCCPRVRVIS